ncbi:glycosyltransferase family 2 protein [Bacteroides acidifaciens]|uniref:glycosyltransferase family 2 protein n=1 Tax=Bacteroides acidifaciens TaxID=85831 RepID=UPI001F58EFDC|nr:glycosyltransferase family 2 protein [Bacteroides acidifaciens]
MENHVLVSVIVPVYNVEGYLEKCVDSILTQTYSYFELILVDDGSKDGSGKLCDLLAAKDSRIICIHKENGGLSSARNAALDVCKGEYITCVDSDDMISPNALELMLEYANKCESDIVVTRYPISFSDDTVTPETAVVTRVKTLAELDATQEIVCKSTRWEAWGHLFKRSLWEDIRFPDGKIYEDFATTPYVFAKAKRTTFIDTAVYYYFQRSGSIMRKSESKVSLDLCTIAQELVSYFKKTVTDGGALANICSGVLMELCSRTDLAAKNINNNREFVSVARKILRTNVRYVLQSDYYSLKQKIYYLMESFCFHWLIYCIHK